MSIAKRLYEQAPYPLKTFLASARGAQLLVWRYGSDLEALVDAAAEREGWSPERWSQHRDPRLARFLDDAARNVPFYREQWNRRRRSGDRASWDEVRNWPLLQKQDLRQQPAAFLAEGFRRRLLFEEHTSGTTGTPLTLLQTRSAVKAWYALFERRVRRWNGVRLGDRWAIVGGQLVTPVGQSSPPYWVWNGPGRQLYLSAFHISPSTAEAYASELARRRIRYVLGYPSALAALAEALSTAEVQLSGIDVVFTNAEPLSDRQRDRINRAFAAPVRDTFGMSEAVVGASECTHGAMHLWPEAGVLEVMDDRADELVGAGVTGRFVATGILNPAMPLIRYETGDRGSIAPSVGCECGRTLPTLQSIEGRMDDVVVTADGRRIGRLDGIFKADLDLQEAQIVQDTLDRFRILYVAGRTGVDEAHLAALLRERVGDAEVAVERVPEIPRTTAGKFRAVISNVPNAPDGA